MEQVLGKPDDNPFIKTVKKESALFNAMIKRVSDKL